MNLQLQQLHSMNIWLKCTSVRGEQFVTLFRSINQHIQLCHCFGQASADEKLTHPQGVHTRDLQMPVVSSANPESSFPTLYTCAHRPLPSTESLNSFAVRTHFHIFQSFTVFNTSSHKRVNGTLLSHEKYFHKTLGKSNP